MNLFRSLRHSNFALLWGGQTLSRVGDFLYEISLAWWVLEKTGSALTMSAVLIFTYVPMLLFLMVGGVMVDRLPRVRVMLTADIGRGFTMVLIAWLAFTDRLEIWQIMLASLFFGLTDAFFQPAFTALVPQVTPRVDWPSANSLASMSTQVGRILGPGMGALLFGLGGAPVAFAINSATFLASAALLAPMWNLDRNMKSISPEKEPGFLTEARHGFSLVLGNPVLWLSIACFAITNITLSGPYSVSMPFLVNDFMGKDVNTLGLLYAIFPIGYLLGGIWLGRKTELRRRGPTAMLSLAVAGFGLLTFGFSAPLIILVVAALFNGAALEVGGLVWTNILQDKVPAEKLGRVSSIDMLGSFILLPLGYGLAGIATEWFGPAPVFVIGGGMTVLIGFFAVLHPAMKTLD